MGARESNSGEIRLELTAPTAVHDAIGAARSFAANAAFDDVTASRLCIIVEELVTNLYDHGDLSADDVVECALTATADGVTLVLSDPGTPFDPRLVSNHVPTPARGGGAGLRLVRSWTRDIDYRVADGRNRLTLLIPSSA